MTVRAMCGKKWQLSLANGFALLRERYLEIDTIPKPCGLGSGSPLNGAVCPVVVRLLSGACPAFVRRILM
jgi:hypothetical protein